MRAATEALADVDAGFPAVRYRMSKDPRIRRLTLPGNGSCTRCVSEAIMIELKTILVPTDFSECSEAAVRYGAALAKTFGATLHLLNVVQDPYMLPWSADGFAAPVGDMLADWEAQAKSRLAESVPATAAANTVVTTRIGSPYTEIVRYAAQHRIDLIVLATHGRGPAWTHSAWQRGRACRADSAVPSADRSLPATRVRGRTRSRARPRPQESRSRRRSAAFSFSFQRSERGAPNQPDSR